MHSPRPGWPKDGHLYGGKMKEGCEWSLHAGAELSTSMHVAPHSAGAGAEKEREQVVSQGLHLFSFLGPQNVRVLPGASVTSLCSALVPLCLCPCV